MNVAVILAGGVGKRMGAPIPKQFIEVNGKPVMVYTLEAFERHPLIDMVEVVCVDGYQDQIWEYKGKYNLNKLEYVTTGGENCQGSTRNGLYNLEGICAEDDIVIIHMAANPLIGEDIITDCIEVTKKYGNAASADPVLAYSFCVADEISADSYIAREKIKLLTMPLGYRFGEVLQVYKQAYAEGKGIYGDVYADTLYADYGKKVYFSKASRRNFKVTTQEDIDLFKAYLLLDAERKEKEND